MMLTLYMLISHAIADFIIQTSVVVEEKSKMSKKGFIHHGLGISLTALPVILVLNLESIKKFVWRLLVIVCIHLVFDIIKENIQNVIKKKEKPKILNVVLFLCDQMLHIAIIIWMTGGVTLEFNGFNKLLANDIIKGGMNDVELKFIFMLIYISFSGAYVIPLLFDVVFQKVNFYNKRLNDILKSDEEENTHGFINEAKTGKWIGILERILILIFLNAHMMSSVGFIIAIKSLARFKLLEHKLFSEYYLLGTLISVVYTFLSYAIFNRIL